LNVKLEPNEIHQDSKIKQNLTQNINAVQEKIDSLERKKIEIKDLSSNIEKSIDQFRNPQTNQKTMEFSKKKSMNFEEYKEKCSVSEDSSVIKEESSIPEIKIDVPLEIKPSPPSSFSMKIEPNIPKILNTSVNEDITEKPIVQWLEEIHLDALLQNFLDLGIESNSLLINLLKKNMQNWDKILITHLGIDKPGYRKRIITKLKEDIGLFKRSGLFKLKHSNARLNFLNLNEWLKSLDLEELTPNFIAAGYDDYESLIFQMTTDNTINERILEEDVLIEDPLARMKICNQLMEGLKLNYCLVFNIFFIV